MLEVALRSLAHDRGKLVAALAGVAFAATLLFVQIGLFVGFLRTSSALISRVGGDVWVMARGTEVLDNGDALPASTRMRVASHPCVSRVRGLVVAVVSFRKPSGAQDYAQIVGVEPSQRPRVPWNIVRGLPDDLHAPLRVAIDEHDLEKFQIRTDPIGASIDVSGRTARIAGLTQGIRSFALYPYLFTEIDNARRLAGLDEASAQYWIADLTHAGCAAGVVRTLGRSPGLSAYTAAEFTRLTEGYWVFGSGAGSALAFSALFALVVGAVIVGQTLFSITKEHLRELATLKAMGASPRELTAFVGWQAGFLALVGGGLGLVMSVDLQRAVGGGLGLVMAVALQRALSSQIEVALSGSVIALGTVAVLSMCFFASIPSVRKALALEAAEVFR
jgi:putative ABC transport system permease protein